MQVAAAVFFNVTSITCAVAAFYLANKGIEGWGWFLLAAIMTANAPNLHLGE